MTWWQYLILANVYMLLFYGFYALLLRRETFFQLNRLYLVASALLSFMIPLIQSDWVSNLFITQRINQTIYQLKPISIATLQPTEATQHYTIGQIICFIYIGGIIVLASKLLMQLILVKRSLQDTDHDDAYSFFGTIKLSEKVANRKVILAHEEVHAKQWHSADVMLIELVMIISWFNPVVYFYRKAIKHVHEFIADRNAIKSGTSKSEYALLLLSETFKTPAHQLVNPFFNHSLLKRRIQMLQKNNSSRRALLKYGLSAPLFALMIILSAATVKSNYIVHVFSTQSKKVLSLTADQPGLTRAYESLTVTDEPVNGKRTANVPDVEEFKPTAKHMVLNATVKADKDQDNDAIFTSVEKSAEFPGGVDAFGTYLRKTIKYPAALKAEDAPLNNRVIAQFVVEKDGKLSNIHVLRGEGAAADEAVRVLQASPDWVPGEQNGIKIRQQYTVPISFTRPDADGAFSGTNPDTSSHRKVIKVVTFAYHNGSPPVPDTMKTTTLRSDVKYIISTKRPLLIINGKEADESTLKQLDAKKIQSINVLKGDMAAKQYGDKATNGVVLIIKKTEKPE